MPLEDIWSRIDTGYGGFSPQLRRAARFVRENPQHVALNSLRAVSRAAGVSPNSMTRLVQALECDSYDAFQAAHRQWLMRDHPASFSGRADRLISDARGLGAEDALLDAIREAERANIAEALGPERRAALRQAAELIHAAPSLSIAGIRSSFPVAFSLHYALALFRPGVRIIMGTGGAVLDDVHDLVAGDLLIVISVAPYSREIVQAAAFARDRKVRVIAITDGSLTPLARLADVTLVAANDSPGHIASPIGPLAVVQALAVMALSRAGEGALETLRRREAALAATAAYVEGEAA